MWSDIQLLRMDKKGSLQHPFIPCPEDRVSQGVDCARVQRVPDLHGNLPLSMSTSNQLSFRCLLLGCVGMLVFVQIAQILWEYKTAAAISSPIFRKAALNPPHDDDLMHLMDLNVRCLADNDDIIPSRAPHMPFTKSADMRDLLTEILRCPEAEVFLPVGIRGHGYCEDGMAYVKFLDTRAMPMWVYEMDFHIDGKTYKYHDLCPHTALILMNHYWDGIETHPSLPSTKKLILMPNIEMYELKKKHYDRVDYVLAKTRDSFRRITEWYSRDGNNPRNTQVLYTQHTSSDPTTLARFKAKTDPAFGPIAARDFVNLTVFHANGRSGQKNTPRVIQCWRDRPDFPTLQLYSNEGSSKDAYNEAKADGAPLANVDFHHGEMVESAAFGKLMAQVSVIVCPSVMEGFGHYINQARASGALVLTTDAPPMNEFIDESSGSLIYGAEARDTGDRVLMGQGTEFDVPHESICAAMDVVLGLDPAERAARAWEGQRRYYEQQHFFKDAMVKLKQMLRADLEANPSTRQPIPNDTPPSTPTPTPSKSRKT
ncbi:Aste57867_2798 [Aphanomyces stellatus]|uniref:Aste57867_2798 protein n=1 Tax=Aphanomyces stellatus TaxID=120398 RepID=A0A485KC34_9STRA|nr:hypothetical protein As57867_002791 [Aphanomyces stellatus]VFT79988.1 Aste57867_2798 [Aphanomyces stellatus]